ncbi:hypothetical protein SDC9_141385 [bioreactor metagenome]|uniref:Uncharacterized protein n=1 Tax=bioreactor metagenome TaxID=1076179 RepID=A0A645DXJ6_9ZZZZ
MNKIDIVILILLIANSVVVAAGATVIGKELNRTNKQIDDAEARTFAHMCKFTGAIKKNS